MAYPTSCSPQAWAAASPLLCLRTMLRLDPWVPYGKTWLSPMLPEGMKYLKVEGIPLAGSRVTVEVDGDDVDVTGLPPEVELVTEPRHPATPSSAVAIRARRPPGVSRRQCLLRVHRPEGGMGHPGLGAAERHHVVDGLGAGRVAAVRVEGRFATTSMAAGGPGPRSIRRTCRTPAGSPARPCSPGPRAATAPTPARRDG